MEFGFTRSMNQLQRIEFVSHLMSTIVFDTPAVVNRYLWPSHRLAKTRPAPHVGWIDSRHGPARKADARFNSAGHVFGSLRLDCPISWFASGVGLPLWAAVNKQGCRNELALVASWSATNRR